MLTLNVLSDGFRAPNARAFLFPLLVQRRALEADGLRFKVFADVAPALTDADVLIVDSQYFRGPGKGAPDRVCALLERLAQGPAALVYFDTSDSAGWLFGEALPLVRRYYKNQLLRDRQCYLAPMYGRRTFTDYYHRHAGIHDEAPETGPQLTDPAQLAKLGVSWNSGLADYTALGARRMALYRYVRAPALLRFPHAFRAPEAPRPHDLHCRFGTAYSRASVAYQRREIVRRLADRVPTGRLSRGAYLEELRHSKAVLSPFGFGEICYRDFEAFLAGGALLKPDMAHLETWPDLYRAHETYVPFAWDLDDLAATIDGLFAEPTRLRAVAAAGQDTYRHWLTAPEAQAAFRARVLDIARDALSERAVAEAPPRQAVG